MAPREIGGLFLPRSSALSGASVEDARTIGKGGHGGSTDPFATDVRPFSRPTAPAQPEFTPAIPRGNLSPVSDPLVRARAAQRTYEPNRGTQTGAATGGWMHVPITQPMVLVPLSVVNEVVLYHPNKQPDSDAVALRSRADGICFLTSPGDWWVAYRETGVVLDYVLVDASDPTTITRFMQEPGVHTCANPVDVNLPIGGVPQVVVAANRYRTALLLQNTTNPTTQVIRVGIGVTPSTTRGFRLVNATSTLLLAGDSLWRGVVTAVPENAGVAATIAALEFT